MAKKKKMICPDCGVELNIHAEKVDYTASLEEPGSVDEFFGGVLLEAGSCPKCGKTEVRPI